VAYVARLVIHRYAMLGVLDTEGRPLAPMGVLAAPGPAAAGAGVPAMAGRRCPECGNGTLIHKDGCEFCTACGYVGQCG
jgi:ribonucleoside-diphosphate reductase alpha chain